MLNDPSNVPSCFDDNKLMYLMVSLFPMSFRYLYIGRNSENWQKSKTEVSQRKEQRSWSEKDQCKEQLSCHGSMQGSMSREYTRTKEVARRDFTHTKNVARIHSHEESRAKRIHSHEESRAKRIHSREVKAPVKFKS